MTVMCFHVVFLVRICLIDDIMVRSFVCYLHTNTIHYCILLHTHTHIHIAQYTLLIYDVFRAISVRLGFIISMKFGDEIDDLLEISCDRT